MQDWKMTSSTRTVVGAIPEEVQIEAVRKSIHVLIAFVPAMAYSLGVVTAMSVLAAGTLVYTVSETLRLQGRNVLLVSRLTVIAARPRDVGHFILGPVTLALGAMVSLMLYPEPAASIAIYALAFGDGIASFAGKLFGTVRIPFSGGKTVEGTFACFAAVFVTTYTVTANPEIAGTVAAAAALIELAPTRDLDNLIMPAGTGLIASYLLF
jgi:dolichol kinase